MARTTSSKKTSKPTSRPNAGRPRIELDIDKVEALARIGCTHDEIGAVLGVSHDTIQDRIKRDVEFSVAYKRGKDTGKMTLRRMQWSAAKAGNITMMIWLGKQILSQTDKRDISISSEAMAKQITDAILKVMPDHRDKVADILEELINADTHH